MLELSHELGSAVDLYGFDSEGCGIAKDLGCRLYRQNQKPSLRVGYGTKSEPVVFPIPFDEARNALCNGYLRLEIKVAHAL